MIFGANGKIFDKIDFFSYNKKRLMNISECGAVVARTVRDREAVSSILTTPTKKSKIDK